MGHARMQWKRRTSMTLVATIAIALAALLVLLTADRGSAEPADVNARRADAEPIKLQGAHTRTFATTERGTRITRVYSGTVNYRSGDTWQPIDNMLEPNAKPGYALRNGANSYSLDLPDSLGDDPVRITSRGSWIAFAPADASSVQGPSADGNDARYKAAFHDADVTYTAQGDSVKEELTLYSREAPSRYGFALTMSADLSPREAAAGGIEFVNDSGDVKMSFAPPFMSDAAGSGSRRVSMRLSGGRGSYAVELAADREWLQAKSRAYPVVIDPTTNINAGVDDCYLVGGAAANTHYCGYSFNWLDVGTDQGSQQRRTYLKFDLTAIPKDAEVIDGDVQVWKEDGTARLVQLHRLTRASTSGRTWNTYDGSNAWTAPGGDIGASPDAGTTTTVTSGWNHWYARKLVQGWIDGTVPNYGVLLRDMNTSPLGDVIHFRSSEQTGTGPYLEVEWQHKLGVQDRYTMKHQRITSDLGLMTNVGNGNLVIQQVDLQVQGAEDLNVDVTRYFNNLDVDGGGGDLGFGWNMGTGYDFWLAFEGGGSTVAVNGPSGYWAPFDKRADGSYEAPPGVNSTLTKASDGTYTLVENGQDQAYHFDSGGTLKSVDNPEGGRITFAYGGPGGKLSQVTDVSGGITRVSYTTAGNVDTIVDPSNRVWRYGYAGTLLASVTRPDGKVTRYEWDSNYNPIKITDVDGKTWRMTYDSKYRVTSIKQVTDAVAGTGPTTSFTYSAPTAACTAYPTAVGQTTQTDPDGTVSTYCYDATTKVLNKPPDYQACLDEAESDDYCSTWWREAPPAIDPGFLNEPDPVDDGIDDYGPCYAEEPAVDCDTSSDEAEPITATGTVSAAATDSLIYGIADDGDVSTFRHNGYFKDLKVRRIRRIIPWDIMRRDSNGNIVDRAAFDKFRAVWLESLKPDATHSTRQNLEIMVSFRHSNIYPNVAPSVARYRKLVKAFRRRFGKRISAIGAWNEPNLGGEPTRYSKAGPKRAADYAWILRRDVCKPSNNCTAVAGEFQMKGQWKNYMTDYKDRLATRATVPSFWGAHPYIDVTKQTSALLDFFVTRLPPSATTVWLTEVGAHIDAKHVSTTTEAAQANRVEFLVNTEARRTGGPPIRRLYYYAMWEQNKFNAANFDTGLLTAGATTDTPIGGNRRQAYTTYKSHTLNNPRG